MSVTLKLLAAGQLSAAGGEAVVYTVPLGKSAVVYSLRVTRREYYPPGEVTKFTFKLRQRGKPDVILFPDGGGAVIGFNQIAIEDRALALGADDRVVADVANIGSGSIDFVMSGAEREA